MNASRVGKYSIALALGRERVRPSSMVIDTFGGYATGPVSLLSPDS